MWFSRLTKRNFMKPQVGGTEIWLTDKRLLRWTGISELAPIGQKKLERQSAGEPLILN
jgi:hypothetical protein